MKLTKPIKTCIGVKCNGKMVEKKKKYIVEVGGPEICLLGGGDEEKGTQRKAKGGAENQIQLYTCTLRARVMVYHQEKCLLVARRPPLVHLLEANFPLVIYRETILQFNGVATPLSLPLPPPLPPASFVTFARAARRMRFK